MKYNSVIWKAIFLRRPNRFQAYVILDDEELLVHVPNTGRCGRQVSLAPWSSG